MSARKTLLASSAIVLFICVVVTAALIASASIFSSSLERVRLAHEDLVAHSDLAIESHQYMQEALKTLNGTGSAQDLSAALERVERSVKAIERTQTRLFEEDEGADDDPDQGEDKRLDVLRTTFASIQKHVAELGKLDRRDPSYQAVLTRTFEDEFEKTFIETIHGAIMDEREDLESAMRGSHALVTRIEIATVSVTVLSLVGLALMLGSVFRSLARAEKLAAVGALAGSIGHELRNPLAAVRNAAQYVDRRIAKSDLSGDKRVREFMEIIDKELAACNKIVGDLLDYARERPLALGPTPLRPLVADAISIVQPPRPMRVENEVPDDLPLFDLDPDLMRQVLVNLIQNATEAVPAEREADVRVKGWVADDTLHIAVSDNGAGVSGPARRRMFEPLFTTKVKGTGLGLAICARITARHGGTIGVESADGTGLVTPGTTVTIRIPKAGRKR